MVQKINLYLIGLFLLLLPLRGSGEEPIVVRVQTESRLLPLYLSHFSSEAPQFEPAYVEQLEAVLRFDFAHNGSTKLLEVTKEREALAQKALHQPEESFQKSKGAGIPYVLVPKMRGNELAFRLFSMEKGSVKELKGGLLTGILADDRRTLHRMADQLHQTLTGTLGIASHRILYTLRTKKGTGWLSDVWECDYDGANARQITHQGEYCVTPSYVPTQGPHAQHFFYVGYGSGQPRIFCASLKDGLGKRVTSAKGNQLMPVLSRQRDQLAFICDAMGSPALCVQTYNPETGQGGPVRTLFAAKGATQSTPTFSPDGRALAFTSDKDGATRIYVIALEPGAQPKLVSRKALNGTAPAWSPDGQKIAFCASTQGTRQIWVYQRATQEEQQLTFGGAHKENPSWAPNSAHLVYNTVSPGNTELYLLDLATLEPVKISRGGGEKRFPSWETLASPGF